MSDSQAVLRRVSVSRDDSIALLRPTQSAGTTRLAYILLSLVPVAIGSAVLCAPGLAVFTLNFISLFPLAVLCTKSVLTLAASSTPLLSGILVGCLGSITELVMCLAAVLAGHPTIVQYLMIGNTFTYSLLVLGLTFFRVSWGHDAARFDQSRTGGIPTLVVASSICLNIPTIMSLTGCVEGSHASPNITHGLRSTSSYSDYIVRRPHTPIDRSSLILSRGTASILMVLFVIYILFRFMTHREYFGGQSVSSLSRVFSIRVVNYAAEEIQPGHMRSGRFHIGYFRQSLEFLGILTCTALCSWYVMHSVRPTAETLGIAEEFVGTIVLPLAGIAGKAVRIITASRTRALDVGIRAIMTNILNILLFVVPATLLFGWAFGAPILLMFGLFESVAFLVAMVVMTSLLQRGKTTYFEGLMLFGTYITIAVAFFLKPDPPVH